MRISSTPPSTWAGVQGRAGHGDPDHLAIPLGDGHPVLAIALVEELHPNGAGEIAQRLDVVDDQ